MKAKRLGKKRIVVLDVNRGTEDLTVLHERSLILKEALQRPEGVIPYFQPIVDIEADAPFEKWNATTWSKNFWPLSPLPSGWRRQRSALFSSGSG